MRHVTAIALGAMLLGWIISPGPVAHGALSQPAMALALSAAAVALAVSCWAWVRHIRRWVFPLHRIRSLLRSIQSGTAPIEALSRIRGPMRPLARQVQGLQRDLRRQQAIVRELALELDQRVAHRTDALERQLGSLRRLAMLDPLTGLQNRRLLGPMLEQLVERQHTVGGELSILIIDIDHFKLLNDELGHAAGDAFLKSVGQIIRSAIRPEDQAFRLGGDELLIVLPDCDRAAATVVRDRLSSLADALAKPLKLSHAPRLSAGIASVSETSPSTAEQQGAEMLRAADRELYALKADHHGRTRRARASNESAASGDRAKSIKLAG